MTITTRIYDLMADGKPRTVNEIAYELEPSFKGESLNILKASIRRSLGRSAKWGEIVVVDRYRIAGYRQQGFVWQKVTA